MIVNTTNEGWEIISQYAHGLLAGRIAAQILPKYRPQLWVETLTAIIEHDDKQIDLDTQSCLSESGFPMDFSLSKPEPQSRLVSRASGLMDLAMNKSRWIAIMISCHLDFLYNNEIAGKEMTAFLKSQREFRKRTLKSFNISENQLNEYYQLLKFSDRLSLILCQNQIPTRGRKLEINKSLDDKTYFVSQNENAEINVEPWCFMENTFELSVETKHIAQVTFSSGAALQKALDRAEVTPKKFVFKALK